MRGTIKKWLGLLPKTRTSNPISKLLRPIFEKGKLSALMLATSTTLLSSMMVVPPGHAFDYSRAEELNTIDTSEVEVTTQTAYAFPVPQALGISQGYHAFHRGIDIRATKGEAVIAVASGMVIEVREQAFGYGKHVRIAHEGTVASLYAHLDQIRVTVGQRVMRGEQIGTVGTTGWATGSHLHFELSEMGATDDPAAIIRVSD